MGITLAIMKERFGFNSIYNLYGMVNIHEKALKEYSARLKVTELTIEDNEEKLDEHQSKLIELLQAKSD